jgi:drug/metabolite transporter (DMT)-like permease
MTFPHAQTVEALWLRLAPSWRGPLWMLLAGLLFSLMAAAVKSLGARIDSFEVAFFRAAFGLFWILPFALVAGREAFRTKRPLAHLGRGLVGALAMVCSFYALAQLPLAEAVAYSFTKPLFVVLLAAVFLGEKVRLRRLSATAAGFLGVVVMLAPERWLQNRGLDAVEPAALVAIFGAALVGVVVIFIKKLIETERPVTVLFYFGLVSTVGTLIPALGEWTWPSPEDLLLLLAVGALGASAQSLVIRAYLAADATIVSPFDYFRLIYAGLIGYVLFGEIPGPRSLIGAGIIVGATLYIAHREARRGIGLKPPLLDQAPLSPSDIAVADLPSPSSGFAPARRAQGR